MATRTPKGTVTRPTSTKAVVKKAASVPAAIEAAAIEAAAIEVVTEAAAAVDAAPAVTIPVEVPAPVADVPVPVAVAPVEPVIETPAVEVPVAEPVAEAVTPAPVAEAPVPAEVPAAKRAAPAPKKSAVPPAAVPATPAPAAAAVAKSAPEVPVAKNVEQAIAQTKEKVEKMSKQVFATFEDVVGFQKDNVEAFVASSTILTKGFEALSKELVAFTQAQYEQSVSTAKALFAVKSVKELVDLQTEFAKTSFDALVAEATKVSETGIKVANQAAEPITARVNATVEKLSKLKAA